MKAAASLLALGLLAGDLTVGGEVPDMTLKSIDGKESKLSELNKAGKVVVIVSWSPDCPSGAVPRITEVGNKYAGNEKVAFFGVNAYGETAEKCAAVVKDQGVKYPVVHDEDKSVSKALGAKKVNAAYVIKDGKLFWRGGAMKNGKDHLEQAIEAALSGAAAPPSDKDKLG
ncbi:MAG TPA: redoxin domain-containing protein [Planctomycetota bacterium]|nr:redoxin domain-containing protein [Planctomycetota bacterium]